MTNQLNNWILGTFGWSVLTVLSSLFWSISEALKVFHLKGNILNSFVFFFNSEFKNRNCSSHHYFPLTQESSLYTICWEIVLRKDLKVREMQDDFWDTGNEYYNPWLCLLFETIYLFIYLAAPGLSHDRRDLLVAAHGIYCPDQVKLGPLHQERGVPATGPPGKVPVFTF